VEVLILGQQEELQQRKKQELNEEIRFTRKKTRRSFSIS